MRVSGSPTGCSPGKRSRRFTTSLMTPVWTVAPHPHADDAGGRQLPAPRISLVSQADESPSWLDLFIIVSVFRPRKSLMV